MNSSFSSNAELVIKEKKREQRNSVNIFINSYSHQESEQQDSTASKLASITIEQLDEGRSRLDSSVSQVTT